MIKRLFLALALIGLSPAFGAGTIPFSLSQQFDNLGKPLAGGRLNLVRAGTTSTPQNCYQDSDLTLPLPNPIILDAAGRVPQMFCADGQIKVRLTTSQGVNVLTVDNIQVVGASSGSGGGGSVDATTVLTTGDFKAVYGTGVLSGFVRCNGRTIGSATSGATERANADTSALFAFLWNIDSNLSVSTGRGVSASADFAANKTITLPDCRGRILAGLDDMGNSASTRLSTTSMSPDAITLGATGGAQSKALVLANLPPYTPSGTVAVTAAGTISSVSPSGWSVSVTSISSTVHTGGVSDNYTSVAGFGTWNSPTRSTITSTGGAGSITGSAVTPTFTNSGSSGTFTGAAQGGVSTPVVVQSPSILVTHYIKL